jgi:hypothetical protein
MEFLGEQPVMGAVKPLPTDPLIASGEAVTIGEVGNACMVWEQCQSSFLV